MYHMEFDDEFHRKEDRVKDTKRQQALELFRERPYQLKVLDEMRKGAQGCLIDSENLTVRRR